MLLNKNKVKIPTVLFELNKVFEKNNFKAYLVGGAVRDIFLDKKPSDFDVATNATPQDVMKLFKIVIPTGFEHGTVTVHFLGEEIEVTTFRTETGYSDGRHPDTVNYAATIEEDLSRRDFTMNAIAVNLSNGEIVDPFDGKNDIRGSIIRTVNNPHERFLEDGLRPIRALRFATTLGFTIDEDTFLEIKNKEVKEKIFSISIERFRDEFEKILKSEKPSIGLRLMEETGIFDFFIPEFSKCRNCVQSDYRCFHKFDVLDHLFYACDGAPKNKLKVRLAALFHDIGKPDAKKIQPIEVFNATKNEKNMVNTITFYNHETFSEKITKEILIRLKFSNEIVNSVCHLIKEHMFHYESNWTNAAVRRFLIRIGNENLEDLYDLRYADMYGMQNQPVEFKYNDSINLLNELKDRINLEIQSNNAVSLKSLAVNGRDLMNIGIPAGKNIGIILNELLDTVIEDPKENQKENLLSIATNIYNQKIK